MSEKKKYTLEQVQNMAFWAVKYANSLMSRGVRTINKDHIDEFIEEKIDDLKNEDHS